LRPRQSFVQEPFNAGASEAAPTAGIAFEDCPRNVICPEDEAFGQSLFVSVCVA